MGIPPERDGVLWAAAQAERLAHVNGSEAKPPGIVEMSGQRFSLAKIADDGCELAERKE